MWYLVVIFPRNGKWQGQKVYRCTVHGQRPLSVTTWCDLFHGMEDDYEMGKFYKIKEMMLMNITIKNDHNYYYRPAASKLTFYLPHINIFGANHCWKTRHEVFQRRHIHIHGWRPFSNENIFAVCLPSSNRAAFVTIKIMARVGALYWDSYNTSYEIPYILFPNHRLY